MQPPTHPRAGNAGAISRKGQSARGTALVLPFLCFALASGAQAPASNPANNPASVPAGATDAKSSKPASIPTAKPAKPAISAKQAREADDAYLQGAKEIERKNTAAAERDFARAAQLNPNDRDYALALIVTRENRITELVQRSAKARLLGDATLADTLVEQARAIDPDNSLLAEHTDASVASADHKPADAIGATLGGPVELAPDAGTHDFHLSGDAQTVIRQVYSAFGITVVFDPSVTSNAPVKFNFDAIRFDDAARILASLTHIFTVPVQPKSALIAKDTQENRDNLQPLVEETIYLPGLNQDQMTELANVARNVFDVKQVTASPTGGFMLVRGDERVLDQLNAIYADLLDSGSEVLFEVKIYEIDNMHVDNIGFAPPTSANVYSIYSEAAKIDAANQSLINTALSSGAFTLTSNSTLNTLLEAEYLLEYGGVTDANLTNLLGTIGSLSSVPLLGLSVSGATTFNLSLTASDARMLDALQLRSSNRQPASLRIGSRYPIVTASYSTGATSNLTAAEQALLKQYTGSTTLSTATAPPQFTFEDLGITLKITPQILRNNSVSMALDMKIESLAGTSIGGNPVLNNRSLVSGLTVPPDQTAMLATLVTSNDVGSIDGLPGLSELPGFQNLTDNDVQKNTDELVITITPHIVRTGSMHISSRRLAAARTGNNSAAQ